MGAVRVSTRGDYASRALLSLALHADTDGPTSVRDIADRTGLPQPYLEQILLALPLKTICSESCKGLCPHCGQNLNVEQCSCAEPVEDPRWAALKDIRNKLEQ